MNAASIILLTLTVIAFMAAAYFHYFRKKGKGSCCSDSCSDSCKGCSLRDSCNRAR